MDSNKRENQMVPPTIHETTDYEQFRTLPGNRDINLRHVDKLVISIQRKDFGKNRPIVVNQMMEVIDGQHTLEARKQLGLPIFYVIQDQAGLAEIQLLNTYVKTWSPYDFLECYCELKNQYYLNFKDFILEYHLSISSGIICLFGKSGGHSAAAFKEGSLTYTQDEMASAQDVANLAGEVAQYFIDSHTVLKGSSNVPVNALKALRFTYVKGASQELLEKLKTNKYRIAIAYTEVEYVRRFEEIINDGRATRVKLL